MLRQQKQEESTRTKVARIALGALLLLNAAVAGAYTIETVNTGNTGGEPIDFDLYKVTISGDTVASGAGEDRFTVTWTIPTGTGNPSNPIPLVASATFIIDSFSTSSLGLTIEIDNTQVLDDVIAYNLANPGSQIDISNANAIGGLNSILALGFNVSDTVTGVNVSDSGNLDWDAVVNGTGSSALPAFKPLDLCIWAANNCSGGSAKNGLIAGTSDTVTLTLAGDFSTGPMTMLLDFPVKMQGLWGSFEAAGVPDGGDTPPTGGEIPEPAVAALMLLGLDGLRRARVRRKNP